MATAARWSWRERIRHRHFLHLWSLRLDDWHLECVLCQAVKDERGRHMSTVPSSDELDIIKEKPVSNVLSVAAKVSKAVAAAIAAGAAAFSAAQVAGSVGAGEWVTVVLAAVGAFVVAYAAPKNTA